MTTMSRMAMASPKRVRRPSLLPDVAPTTTAIAAAASSVSTSGLTNCSRMRRTLLFFFASGRRFSP